MCGIVGCVGLEDSKNYLIGGLKVLEYRGYDSAGIAMIADDEVHVRKAVGMVAELEKMCHDFPRKGSVGIAHTRWATHGGVTQDNAHPHMDAAGNIAVVHNGIVENHNALRTLLEREGIKFKTQTDTEVIAHLVSKFYEDDLAEAVRLALREIRGTFGIAVISKKEPNVLVAARMGSPLVLGVGKDCLLLASDAAPILPYTQQAIYLNNGELLKATPQGYEFFSLDRTSITPKIEELDQQLESIELGQFPHYMLKEIYDQPTSLENTLRGRLKAEAGDVHLGGPGLSLKTIHALNRVIIVGCGTSFHAGLCAKYLFEEFLRIPCEVEYASELRYRNPIVRPKSDLAIFISQSGETADTLAALRELQRKGCRTLGIVNVVNSSIAREVDSGIYTHAGMEIGVASTKAFTAQVAALTLFALYLGRSRDFSSFVLQEMTESLAKIPTLIEDYLVDTTQIEDIAEEVRNARNLLYLGRGYQYPVALEGALKMKEISYIHAEGYPAAEMKHGPIALVDENMPVVAIATRDRTYEKVVSNMQEIKARNGKIIAVTTEGNTDIEKLAWRTIYVPHTIEPIQPLLTSIPLQLLAYYVAVKNGRNVDKPRNLAKSVTVE